MRRPWVRVAIAALVATATLGITSTSGAAPSETLFGGIGGLGASSPLLGLDPASGALLESRGSNAFGITGLAINPVDKVLYGVTTPAIGGGPRFLVRIDRATGIATTVGPLGLTIADITFTADGTLYGWSESGDDLARIDLATGVATIVANSGLGTFGSGIAFDEANNRLLFAGEGGGGDLRAVDRATGTTTVVSTLNGADISVSALAFDCAGTLYGVELDEDATRDTQLVIIDPATGNVTVVGPSENRLDAIVFDCTSSSDRDDDDHDKKKETPAPPAASVVVTPTFTG